MKTKIWVGLKGGHRYVFRHASTPTEEKYGHLYEAIIGPFRTLQGAKFMVESGGGNPHVRDVADAERLAKKYGARKQYAKRKVY